MAKIAILALFGIFAPPVQLIPRVPGSRNITKTQEMARNRGTSRAAHLAILARVLGILDR